jgi:hypothetical protein
VTSSSQTTSTANQTTSRSIIVSKEADGSINWSAFNNIQVNENGSFTSTTTVYDPQGGQVAQDVYQSNVDGSSLETITNFYGDGSIAQITQIFTDINGDSTSTTTNPPAGGNGGQDGGQNQGGGQAQTDGGGQGQGGQDPGGQDGGQDPGGQDGGGQDPGGGQGGGDAG